jgi:hypothetical protein
MIHESVYLPFKNLLQDDAAFGGGDNGVIKKLGQFHGGVHCLKNPDHVLPDGLCVLLFAGQIK